MDMAKYRGIFVEESTEHLSEMSSALLLLEKLSDDTEAIDLIFRMAHSIKGMAASLGFDSVTELAHSLEDRMQVIRAEGRVSGPEELALLFRGLDRLESMVATVRDSDETPPPDPALAALLAESDPDAWADIPVALPKAAKKKLLTPAR